MVAGRIDAMGTPAELKQRRGRRVDRRAVRAPGATDGAIEATRRDVNALWGLLRKETYHILRDRRTLAVLIFMPIVQVILFGYSIRTDVTRRASRDRRPVAGCDDARDARPIQRERRVPNRRRAADGRGPRRRCFETERRRWRSSSSRSFGAARSRRRGAGSCSSSPTRPSRTPAPRGRPT